MAKISVPYVVWRDGRPRFSPSPQMRQHGIAGADLKHPSKTWFSIEECKAYVETQMARYLAARDGVVLMVPQKDGPPTPLPAKVLAFKPAAKGYSFEALFNDYFNWGGFKDLAPKTQHDYRGKARAMGNHAPELYAANVQDTKRAQLFSLWDTIDDKAGTHQATAVLRVISLAITWGMQRGKLPSFEFNPCMKMGLAAGEARVRCWTAAEVDHVVKTADVMGVPELGDAIILGVWTGQRQGDRLAMVQGPVDGHGRRRFVQSKTGAIVEILEVPELAERLAAAKARKEAIQLAWQAKGINRPVDEEAIISTATERAFKPDHYRHIFRDLVQAAYKGVKDKDGVQIVQPMPSMWNDKTGLPRDQDLRDTCVTWLANAGCTHSEIASITGHTEASIASILIHYLAKDPVRSDNAIAKLRAYRQR